MANLLTHTAQAAVGLALLVMPAAADTITRGCHAEIRINGDGIPDSVLARLDARGSCEGRVNANRCRLRAYNVLRTCLDAVEREWANHEIPTVCLPSTGLRSGMNYFRFDGIYPLMPNGQNSIEDRIWTRSCCDARRLGTHEVNVTWNASGDVGCDGSTDPPWEGNGRVGGVIWGSIETQCSAIWDAGLCPGERPRPQRTNE